MKVEIYCFLSIKSKEFFRPKVKIAGSLQNRDKVEEFIDHILKVDGLEGKEATS